MFFAAWIGWGPSGARVIIGSLRIGLVSAVASLGLQGLDLLNLPLSGLLSFAPWTSALGTSLGPSLSDCDRSDADCTVRVAKPDHDDRMAVDRRCDGRRRAVAGNQRSRRDRAAGMADRARRVHPRRCGRLLGRRVGADCSRWRGGGQRVAAGAQAILGVAMPLVGLLVLSGFGLAIVQLESFGALVETRYGIILLDQTGAGGDVARSRGAEPVSRHAGAHDGSVGHAAIAGIGPV